MEQKGGIDMDFYIVDVFAEEKYQGNQLAVLVPDSNLTTKEMQQIAKEIYFSETSFIMSNKQENGGYDVRIFTPDEEVPFRDTLPWAQRISSTGLWKTERTLKSS
jgi:PhzF family phenazine biosynthesis protein